MSAPHQNQPLVTGGTTLEAATAALVLLHGRGATAESIVQLAEPFHHAGVAYLAPQAADDTWYPQSFLAPVEANEPGRTSGLRAVGDAISRANEAGIETDRIGLLGFSQGACLASEYVACHPRRYGGLVVLSGGLIGETIDEDDYAGDLERTSVFLGCGDRDTHIPVERVHESAAVFEQLNGDVTTRIYEGMGHTINQDESDRVSEMVTDLVE